MSKFRGIIYKTTCLKTSKSYIGQQRKINKESLKEYLGSGELLREVIKQYGKKNFKKKILVDKFFKNQKELNELETEYIIKEKTLYSNGYNRTLRCWPPDLEAIKRGIETNRKNKTGFFDSKVQSKLSRKAVEISRKNKLGWFSSKVQSKNGKKAWKNNYKRMVEISSKAGKIGGKNVQKVLKEKKLGFYNPETNKIGGKNHAHVIFEIDGIYQQMTLGQILKF